MSCQRKNPLVALAFASGLFGWTLTFAALAGADGTHDGAGRPTMSDAGSLHADPARGNDAGPLLTLIVTWLSANFDLPANYDHPRLELVPAERIAALRFGSSASRGSRDVVAVYHDRKRTIYLSNRWTGESPAELSLLVHEMVHHLQNIGKQSFLCAEERERPAYDAQQRWLGLFGKSLASEFEIDPLTLKVSTSCM